MKSSTFFSLGWKDVFKGFVTAFLSAFLTGLYQVLSTGKMPTSSEWKTVLIVGITAGVAYLIKNLFTNSQDQLLTKEPPKE